MPNWLLGVFAPPVMREDASSDEVLDLWSGIFRVSIHGAGAAAIMY